MDIKSESKIQQFLDDIHGNTYSLCVRNESGVIFQSSRPRLKPLVECLTLHLAEMEGALAIDRVVGRAAAQLFVLAGIRRVVTPVTSKAAKEMLEKNNIAFYSERVVDAILNREKNGLCPMEQLSYEYADPVKFYEKLKELMEL